MEDTNSCTHIADYKQEFTTKEYEAIQGFLISRVYKESLELTTQVFCHICKTICNRLHACMSCTFLGCYGECLRKHAEEKEHYFAAELLYGNIYCFQCRDYVYDKDFEDLMEKYIERSKKLYNYTTQPVWKPSQEEVDCIKMSGGVKNCLPGLKGIVNFSSQTCYLNCIIQVFIHMPVLQSYFLSEFQSEDISSKDSIMNEMRKIFQEFYSEREASQIIIPVKLFCLMLPYMEVEKDLLNSAGQKDAFDFYLKLIGELQENVSNDDKLTLSQIFQVHFCKQYYCQSENCGKVTTKEDYTLFITAYPDEKVSKLLSECLDETYGLPSIHDNSFKCEGCKNAIYIQEKITKLPFVLCFYVSRLQYKDIPNKKGDKFLRKVLTPIYFPDIIDMKPYLNQKNDTDITHFSLYAVVVHKEDNNKLGDTRILGHYFTYVRQSAGNWWKCDDRSISQIDKDKVFKKEEVFSNAYLVFYQKNEVVSP